MEHKNAPPEKFAFLRIGWGLLPGENSKILYIEELFSGYPSCARSPSDALFHSTIDGTDPSNVAFRRSSPGGDLLLPGCGRHGRERPGPIALRRAPRRVDTWSDHRRVQLVSQRTTKVPPPLLLLPQFFPIVESKSPPLRLT